MNEKITLPTLVSLLSNHSGVSKKQCEDFLREFFNVIVETVSEGENVRIKGLGAFKIIDVEPRKSVDVNTGQPIEIPGHRKIVFVPSKELAEDINEPFAIFESVEIPDDAEELDIEIPTASEPATSEYVLDETVNETSEIIEDKETEESENNVNKVSVALIKASTETQSHPETNSLPDNGNEVENEGIISEPEDEQLQEIEPSQEEEPFYEEPRKRSYRFAWGLLCGMLLMALIGCGIFFLFPQLLNFNQKASDKEIVLVSDTVSLNKQIETVLPEETSQSADSLSQKNDSIVSKQQAIELPKEADVPTSPSDSKPVYDTISKTRYLTTMAKEHYGNYNLWPYIYEENKKFLGHPDRIKPGTRVVIPPLSKYGVDPSNPDDIRKAKQKGVEIYSRY